MKKIFGNNKLKMPRVLVATLIMAFLIISQTGCGKQEPVSKSEFCLDTQCDITIYDKSESEAEEILDEAFALIAKLEGELSRTVKGSDVDRLNKAGGKETAVGEYCQKALFRSNEMRELSGGSFNITIGRVSSLWDFKSEIPDVPDAADIEEGLKTVEGARVLIDSGKVTLTNAGTMIDLGGIAKGYIADEVCEFLEEKGVTSGIINLGGNVVAIGENTDGSAWNIGIERPYSDRTELIGVVQVRDSTVVTSGIYERMFEKDGKIYHHILDPETGYPADSDLEAITIVAGKGWSGLCDGLSTACIVKGSEGALELIELVKDIHPEAEIEAALILKDGSIIETDGMDIKPAK